MTEEEYQEETMLLATEYVEDEFDNIEQYEDGSGPSEAIMLQRFYAKMAEEESPNPDY
jgi:hypothetical protein